MGDAILVNIAVHNMQTYIHAYISIINNNNNNIIIICDQDR